MTVPMICMPADFQQQSAILLGANELFPYHPQVMIDLAKVLLDRIPLIAVVRSEGQRLTLLTTLCDWGLPAHKLRCVCSAAQGLWVRDYGPTFVKRNGYVYALDPEYWYPDRLADDRFPTDFANLLGVTAQPVPLLVEGGNLLSNGRGLALCSTALTDRNAARYQRVEAIKILCAYYGFKAVAGVRPLVGCPTAHIDMFATFTAPDTLVLGKYRQADDPANARQLDEAEQTVRGMETGAGPLKVVRIPMPPHADGVWRTYTNVLFANDLVVVPRYAGVDPGIEREALDIYRDLLPGRNVVTVEATSLAKTGGVLRCVSLNIPYLGHPLGWEEPAVPEHRVMPMRPI